MTLRTVPTARDWEICQEIARVHGRSFFLASRMLGAERRRNILSAYAYCRLADDAVDCAEGGPDQVEATLQAWEAELEMPRHPVAVAFADARARYSIPEQPVRELFDGMRADLTIDRYHSWPELRTYCYQVAGTVGLIVAPILGCTDARVLPHAADLGIAMQLTNILRDVREDAELGRIYLPLDELAGFGIDPDALLAGNPGPGFPELMRFQVARARELYAQARAGVPSLAPSGRLTTLVAAELYAGILDRIESSRYDVFTERAVVPRGVKARKLGRAALRFASMTELPVHWDRGEPRYPAPAALPADADAERVL